MVKIIYVFTHFLPNLGGTELPIYHYARELTRRGHDVSVFTTNAIKFKPYKLKKEEVIDGIFVKRFNFIPLPYPFHFLFFSPLIIPALIKVNADIIQVFSFIPSFFTIISCFIAKMKNVPLVLYPQYHPYRSYQYTSLLKKAGSLFFERSIGRRLLKMADFVIALTDFEAEFYRRKGIEKVKVIYEGISLPAPIPQTQISKIREKYSLKANDKILLAVGRISWYKGFDVLIESIQKVLSVFPETKLFIVGEDWGYMSRCKKQAKRLGLDNQVVFTGRITDLGLSCIYELASIVVVPSLYESYGRVIVEAWSHKKPVIASKTVGLSEMISGENGILVDYGDVEDLAKSILRLLQDQGLAKSMGRRGFQLVEGLTWERRINKIVDLYTGLGRS